MTQPTGTTSTAGTPAAEGVFSGQVLRLIRDGLGLTQEQLAERAGVDVNTVKGWESGRRSLGRVKVQTLLALRRRLQQLGANATLLNYLEFAIDADGFVSDVLHGAHSDDPADHLLGAWVSTRAWNDLLAWTFTGMPPSPLRQMPQPARASIAAPRLGAANRQQFFDWLRLTAERTLNRRGDAAAVLLRRQVYFMAAWDDSGPGRTWLSQMEHQELRQLRRQAGWSPTWVAGRSLAVARACQGDREQLRHFIATQLSDDENCEAANLTYWAYWIGEQPIPATGDAFMADDLGSWHGAALLTHLVQGLDSATPYIDLSVHAVWALVQRRPHLLDDDQGVTAHLLTRSSRLLDDGALVGQARRELDQVHYAARMRRTPR